MFKKTLLVNKHGDEFTGWSEYSFKPATGELIFNTAMTGFVEILSDPSYINQIVTFTSSHVGNYGLSEVDFESNKPKIEAAVGNTFSHSPSSWRSQKALTSWLAEYEIPFSGGFDVRAITKYLRERGTSMYALGVDIDKNDLLELLNSATNILGDDSALTAGNLDISSNAPEGKVGILDLGAKKSIVNVLENLNYQVVAIKPDSSAEDILSMNLKGLLISNGPGDPRSLINVIKTINNLIGKIPIFGICLGHQILALTLGAKTKKMKLGHRGANHPVKNLIKGNVEITSQNHGFEVVKNSLSKNIQITHQSLFDNSIEGIRLKNKPVFSVQYHPESNPGPQDSVYLFEEFVRSMKKNAKKKRY